MVEHDDDYLQKMSEVTQEVAGVRYRPWMVFEDGRPWPREDWPTASTYDDVIAQQPDVFQVGTADLCAQHARPARLLERALVARRRDLQGGQSLDFGLCESRHGAARHAD